MPLAPLPLVFLQMLGWEMNAAGLRQLYPKAKVTNPNVFRGPAGNISVRIRMDTLESPFHA